MCVCLFRMVCVWCGGVMGVMFCVVCVSLVWVMVNVEGVLFDDVVCVVGCELLFNGMGLCLVFVIKGYVVGLYLFECVKNVVVIFGMKGLKCL